MSILGEGGQGYSRGHGDAVGGDPEEILLLFYPLRQVVIVAEDVERDRPEPTGEGIGGEKGRMAT